MFIRQEARLGSLSALPMLGNINDHRGRQQGDAANIEQALPRTAPAKRRIHGR